jgi:hypothetical protein
MSDDEDDYLSDKFLLLGDASSSNPSSSRPKTYSELRKDALRASEAKQAVARKRSQREIVEEGLNTSLFEKAKEQEAAGLGKNKALGMMMRMGFKPGQSLGRTTSPGAAVSDREAPVVTDGMTNAASVANDPTDTDRSASHDSSQSSSKQQRTEPIAINLWEGMLLLVYGQSLSCFPPYPATGRSGIGQKRPHSSKANPYAPAKKARTSESEAKENESAGAFRERTRREYEEKRAEARLIAATRTCVSLDEESKGLNVCSNLNLPRFALNFFSRQFNILWLNPKNPNTCPAELLKAFARDAATEDLDDNLDNPALDRSSEILDDEDEPVPRQLDERRVRDPGPDEPSRVARLRGQMRKDALQSTTGFDDAEQDFGGYPFGLRRQSDDNDAGADNEADALEFSLEQVAEARQFLSLQVRGYDHLRQNLTCSNCSQKAKDRLDRVLSYMRDQYAYCFWCGTRYRDKEDMDASCPGQNEEAHD